MRIHYKTGLAMVAGLTVMAVFAQRIPAAVTIMSTDVPKSILDLATVTSTLNFIEFGLTTDVDVATLWGITADGPPPLPVELMKLEVN